MINNFTPSNFTILRFSFLLGLEWLHSATCGLYTWWSINFTLTETVLLYLMHYFYGVTNNVFYFIYLSSILGAFLILISNSRSFINSEIFLENEQISWIFKLKWDHLLVDFIIISSLSPVDSTVGQLEIHILSSTISQPLA